MDEILKQRLIGAALVIALAVIFVPMFFDEPGDPRLQRTLDSDMPTSPIANQEVRRLPLNPNASRVQSAPPPSTDTNSASGSEASVGRVQPNVSSEIANDIDQSTPSNSSSATTVEGSTDTDSVEEPSVAVDSPRARTAERSAESTEDSVGSKIDWSVVWRVQVASFGSEERAQAVVSDLASVGYRAHVDRVVRGDSVLYRIQAGPFPSESAAQAALAEIAESIAGITPIIRPPSETSTAAIASGYAVQVGSFTSVSNVQRLEARLEAAGFSVYSFDELVSDRVIWRVRVGTVPTREEADALLLVLKDEADLEGIVVSQP
jgi:DedD protein